MVAKLIEKLARALEAEGVAYMIIGGQALLIYGEPRLTRDIDLTLGIGPEQFSRIVRLAGKLGLKMLPGKIEEFVHKHLVLPAIFEKTGVRVDFIFSLSPYEAQALKRVRRVKFGKARARFASPEDVVIHKIVSGRPRDLEDVKSIFAKQKKMDLRYLKNWLAQIDPESAADYLQTLDRLKA